MEYSVSLGFGYVSHHWFRLSTPILDSVKSTGKKLLFLRVVMLKISYGQQAELAITSILL